MLWSEECSAGKYATAYIFRCLGANTALAWTRHSGQRRESAVLAREADPAERRVAQQLRRTKPERFRACGREAESKNGLCLPGTGRCSPEQGHLAWLGGVFGPYDSTRT